MLTRLVLASEPQREISSTCSRNEDFVNVETANRWPELYREELLQSDPRMVPARIWEAHKAICRRALELSCVGWITTPERDREMALHFLDLLRMVGPIKAELARINRVG